MLSIPDMALLGAAALLLFGPDQLPKVVRKVGQFTREVQNTSQSFIREMERAAEVRENPATTESPSMAQHGAETYEPFPFDEHLTPHVDHIPPHVDDLTVHVDDVTVPVAVPPVGEKLAEPRPAIAHEEADTVAMPAPVPRVEP
jgi:sec-independent protein translocase protein TatA